MSFPKKRRIRGLGRFNGLGRITALGGSVELLAVSFAVGTFIAVGPFPGLNTALGILTSMVFGLNKPATIAGTYVTNPWTVVPVYAFNAWLGMRLLGWKDVVPGGVDFVAMDVPVLLDLVKGIAVPFAVGSLVNALLGAGLSFFIVKWLLERIRKGASSG
jgi:uncharacterized protein (DUF2062 family)